MASKRSEKTQTATILFWPGRWTVKSAIVTAATTTATPAAATSYLSNGVHCSRHSQQQQQRQKQEQQEQEQQQQQRQKQQQLQQQQQQQQVTWRKHWTMQRWSQTTIRIQFYNSSTCHFEDYDKGIHSFEILGFFRILRMPTSPEKKVETVTTTTTTTTHIE